MVATTILAARAGYLVIVYLIGIIGYLNFRTRLSLYAIRAITSASVNSTSTTVNYTTLSNMKSNDTLSKSVLKIIINNNNNNNNNSKSSYSKLVLLWSPSERVHWKRDFSKKQLMTECPQYKCTMTSDKSLLESANAVVFHWPELAKRKASPPPVRIPGQLYAFFSLESAGYYPHSSAPAYENMFNWTISYRHDSTFHLPYGVIANRSKDTAYDPDRAKTVFDGKTKTVAWFASNCPSKSRRERFVNELKKHISVDIYGRCGTMACKQNDTLLPDNCEQMAEREYFFYLAFENSICKDYVTEKLFHFLMLDIVPIVLRRHVAAAVAPNSSFIAVDDFKDAKQLSNYLLFLASNRTAYMEYFRWKQDFVSKPLQNWKYDSPQYDASMAFCQLCQALHNESRHSETVNLQKWWTNESKCESLSM